MLELAGSQFARGVLELRLEKVAPPGLGWLLGLGPIKGRLLALLLLLSSSLTHFLQQPALTFVEMGWFDGPASRLQPWLSWPVFGVGLVLYLIVFFVRKESLVISVDRSGKEMRYLLVPAFAKGSIREGLIPFSAIQSIEVGGPNRTPKTDFGWVRFQLPEGHPKVEFKVLSAEQAQFYPLNLSKLTACPVVGDWVDPEN
jgi:hypothetical protein